MKAATRVETKCFVTPLNSSESAPPQVVLEATLTVKAKFHYAVWSHTGPKLVADLSRT